MYYVYIIRNIISDKVYVGSTKRGKQRLYNHKTYLRKQTHKNRRLQKDWNLYGEEYFEFKIIEEYEELDLAIKREQYFIDLHTSLNGVYNVLPNAGTPRGRKHIEPTKRRISESAKGRKLSAEQIEYLRKINTGRKVSEETRIKMSIAQKSKAENTVEWAHAKMKTSDVYEFLRLLDTGLTVPQLCEKYGISKRNGYKIANGESWKKVYEKYKSENNESEAV